MLLKLDSSTTTQKSHNFNIEYSNLALEKDAMYQIGLVKASIWYSFSNIRASFGNNTIEYSRDGGANWETAITFVDGIYSVDAINSYIHSILLQRNHYTVVDGVNTFHIVVKANYTTLKVDIELSNSYQLRFGNSKINELLGFDNSQSVLTATTSGNNLANITRDVNSLHIHCSIATGSYENSATSDLIYSFVPNVTPGSLMDISPNKVLYVPINTSNNIYNIRMSVTDQLNREVDLNGEKTTYLLELRKVKA